jgi:UDP-N-acetylmuramate dehydrogenase
METLPFDFALENHRLAPLTLYNVGGPARLALAPRTVEEAVAAYEWLKAQPGRKLVLGGGSNMLISDAGFDGIVLLTGGLERLEALGDDRYSAESGVVLDRLVREVMLPNNYDGVGGLTGIPGSVGGAIFMNAGTVNGSTCQLLESVEVVSPEGYREVAMEPSLYGYRGQRFCPRGGLVLRGTFRFARAEKDQRAIYEHYLERRKEKQPQGYCCGSVFKNPEGEHAGRLIESCGLKGTRHGGAIISPMHANFIMNEDNASSEDILWLIDLCKRTVRERFGVELEEEVAIIV